MAEMIMDPQASIAGRDAGVARVRAKDAEWHQLARTLVLSAMRHQYPEGCLMESARHKALEWGLPEPHTPHAWGAVTLYLARAGLIARTGVWARSGSLRSHSRMQPVWKARWTRAHA